MAATFASVATTAIANMALGATLNAPSGVTSGDTLLAHISSDYNSTNDPTFTGWTKLDTQAQSGPDGHRQLLYGRIATGSDPYDISGGDSPSQTLASVSRYTGSTGVLPTNWAKTVNTSSNTTPISASMTGITASDGSCIACMIGLDITSISAVWAFTTITDYTERVETADSNWNVINLQTRDSVSAGATGSLATTISRTSGSGNSGYAGFVVEIPAGAGGGGGFLNRNYFWDNY